MHWWSAASVFFHEVLWIKMDRLRKRWPSETSGGCTGHCRDAEIIKSKLPCCCLRTRSAVDGTTVFVTPIHHG
jgi:hypothetical protein